MAKTVKSVKRRLQFEMTFGSYVYFGKGKGFSGKWEGGVDCVVDAVKAASHTHTHTH